MPRPLLLACVALVCLVAPACNNASVTFRLGPEDLTLRETRVLGDGPAAAKIALIDLTGVIADQPTPSLLGPGANPLNEVLVRLEKAAEDPDVRAIVLRINSPGGTVAATEALAGELDRMRAIKPIVASMSEVAASGGYYAALATDRIVAQPTSITGSIGVVLPTVNVSQGMARLGIQSRAITSGPNKTLASPLEPMDETHYAILQSLVDDMYGAFRTRVATARNLTDDHTLDPLTDGRVFTGTQALDAGLVDQLGDVRVAFAEAKSLAGVTSAQLVKYHYGKSTRPRSPYATTSVPTPRAEGAAVASVDLNLAEALAAAPPGAAYYLWVPGQWP